jgi:predicted transcriptional regulator
LSNPVHILNELEAMPVLHHLTDRISYKIILSTIDHAKTTIDLSNENNLPLSSTYKRLRKLQSLGIISIEKINIDDKGKKTIWYRSRIKSLEFSLRKGKVLLQLEKNELTTSSKR